MCKTIYFSCDTGVSGDMIVGALLDLGASQNNLRKQLKSLGLPPDAYRLQFARTKKTGIDAFDFDVLLPDSYHHEHEHYHHHKHPHPHDDYHHDPAPHTHVHAHRGLSEILAMIEQSTIPPQAKKLAEKTFRIIAAAEAKAHGVAEQEVHFHEVGAVDSIVDIVGAAVCLADLGVDRVICSPLSEGVGTVQCAHGIMPVPVPAVANIAAAKGVPLTITGITGELVTPTGIALMCAMAEKFSRPAQMNIKKIGYGAGNKNLPDHANVLRAFLLQGQPHTDTPPAKSDAITLIETNIDDQSAETLAFACENLLAAGALDVWLTSIVMKKGRAAHTLSLLCDPALTKALIRLIFLHTSSIGVRLQRWEREVMSRTTQTVSTPYGDIALKRCVYDAETGEQVCKHDLEFETLKKAALAHDVSIEVVATAAISAINRSLD